MPIPDAQGATVTFDGVVLGSLTGIQSSRSTGSAFDCSSMLSPVIGSGANTRVVRQINPTSVEPGTLSITFLGDTIFTQEDFGRVASLSFELPSGGALVGLAYLENVEQEAAAGEKLRGSATFRLTGFT